MAENNLTTKRQEKIITQLGGDVSTLKTNLESERWDVIDSLASGGSTGGGGSTEGNNARINVANYNNTQLTLNKTIEFADYSNQDVSKFTSFFNMFLYCTSLKKVILPSNTSHITSTKQMFCDCPSLEDINYMDISGVTEMNSMFSNCTSLSDESLNNILLMCANATSYTGTKTLKQIGIIVDPIVERCKNLSNYQAFLNAGWTTG